MRKIINEFLQYKYKTTKISIRGPSLTKLDVITLNLTSIVSFLFILKDWIEFSWFLTLLDKFFKML